MEVPVVRRPRQRCVSHHASLLYIRALIDEKLDAREVSVARGEQQRRVAAVVGIVQWGALIDVFLHPIVVSVHAVAPDVALLRDELPALYIM